MMFRLRDIKQDGATTGQVATWDGTKWAAATGGGGSTTLRGIIISSNNIGGGGGSLLPASVVGTAVPDFGVFPCIANDEIIVQIASQSVGTFSTCALNVSKVADATGIPVSPTVNTSRTQTGTGLSAINFPAYTATADFAAPTVNASNIGIKVLNAGFYQVLVQMVWDS